MGTTNRTHPGDYEQAIGPNTGLLLKVHTSNYRIVGFSADVALGDLVAIGRSRGVPVMEDLGSGALVDLSRYGLPKEPLVSERVSLGADIVTFSGDKVLGGPQAGLIVGSRALVRQIAGNPLHRAVRCSKLTLAALEATLKLYQQSADVARSIPTLRAFTRSLDEIAEMGRHVLPSLQRALGAGCRVSLEDSTSQIGSGALPTEELPTKVIAIESDSLSADRLAERFRAAHPPIIGRISDGRFLLDLRTVDDPADLVPRWETGVTTHWIVGTAGHIDHGKTSLVKALTGQNTDRLKEEQERGISIELGFAHLDLPDGIRAGVVDVPGHERFIRTMLAGAHGMDLVLFTVAADDGVMPQTVEHLDILHLLGVERAIFVITKTDLVSEERRARGERRDPRTDRGHDARRNRRRALLVRHRRRPGGAARPDCADVFASSGKPKPDGRFRLPVDRAFASPGHGLIVTGTAIAR